MRPRTLVVGLAVLVAPAALAQEPEGEQPFAAPPPGVSLTGRWRLDPKLSDEPGNKVREAMKGLQSDQDHRRPPVYPDPGGITGDRGEGGAPTGPGVDITTPGMTGTPGTGDPFERGGSSRSSRSQSRAAFDYVLDLPETLTIAQRPSLILIQENDDEGRVRALRPDGTRVRSTDGESESRTRWEKGLLRVDTWHDDGVRVEEIFELAPDGSLLTVTVGVNDGGSAISLERVFRPDESDES
jgi:hypothetical protein